MVVCPTNTWLEMLNPIKLSRSGTTVVAFTSTMTVSGMPEASFSGCVVGPDGSWTMTVALVCNEPVPSELFTAVWMSTTVPPCDAARATLVARSGQTLFHDYNHAQFDETQQKNQENRQQRSNSTEMLPFRFDCFAVSRHDRA